MEDVKATGSSRRTAEDRRARIITAARRLFAHQGFHRTGMAHIARESGVLVGQIYRDFGSKEDIIAAIVEHDSAELLDDPALESVDGDAFDLESWVERFVTRAPDCEGRAILANIISEATLNPRYAVILHEAYDRLSDRLLRGIVIWAPGPEKDAARRRLVDFILTIGAGLHHHRIVGLPIDERVMGRITDIIAAEIHAFRESC